MSTEQTDSKAPAAFPLRNLAVVVVALGAWAIATALILIEISSWPYFGAKLLSGGRASPTFIEHVQVDGPAARAGLIEGSEIIALSGDNGARYDLTGFEAIPGREALHSYADANDARVAKLESWRMLSSGAVTFEFASGASVSISPEPTRQIISIPFHAFNFLLQSLIIVTIAAGILAFAPTTIPVVFLVLSGIAMSVNMMLNVLSASSEMSMPPALWAIYDVAVPTALVTFCFGLLGLLWSFLTPNRQVLVALFLSAAWVVTVFGQQSQLFVFPIHPFQGPYLFTVLPAILMGALAWRRTRHDPLRRASVMWFVLSILIGALFSGLFYTLPVALGYPPLISTAVTLFAVTLIYIGLAFGTLRFRLFDIQRIWWRAITWMVGGLLVVLVDIFLIASFDFEQRAALPIAIFVIGWVYFPIRQWVFAYFVNPDEIRSSEHVRDLIEVYSGSDDPESFDGRFVLFLKRLFGAQDVARLQDTLSPKPTLTNSGLSMRVPAISGQGAIELSGKRNGTRLFSLGDVQAVSTLHGLARFLTDGQARAFEDLQRERERIMRDLHDNVGGRLLSIAYKARDPAISTTARETIRALKDTLFLIEDTQMVDVGVAWSKVIEEAETRLSDAGFTLRVNETFLSERTLSAQEYINLKRSLQEIVSNIIKHGASEIQVLASISVDRESMIEITLKNASLNAPTGQNLDVARGLTNLRLRMEDIGGQAHVELLTTSDVAQFHVSLQLPFAG